MKYYRGTALVPDAGNKNLKIIHAAKAVFQGHDYKRITIDGNDMKNGTKMNNKDSEVKSKKN